LQKKKSKRSRSLHAGCISGVVGRCCSSLAGRETWGSRCLGSFSEGSDHSNLLYFALVLLHVKSSASAV
jgi:hypothetical protein